jgi:signal peptidase II
MENESTNKNFLKLTFLFIALVFIDQLAKYLVRHSGGFYICNPGIAFGIQLPSYIFWIFWTIIIAIILYFLFKSRLILTSFYFILILSGALSNIIDRAYFSCVIDFIDLKIWPVFNLADSFVTLGAIGIILSTLKSNQSSKN